MVNFLLNNFYINKKINIVELGAGNGEMLNNIISSSKNLKIFFQIVTL